MPRGRGFLGSQPRLCSLLETGFCSRATCLQDGCPEQGCLREASARFRASLTEGQQDHVSPGWVSCAGLPPGGLSEVQGHRLLKADPEDPGEVCRQTQIILRTQLPVQLL